MKAKTNKTTTHNNNNNKNSRYINIPFFNFKWNNERNWKGIRFWKLSNKEIYSLFKFDKFAVFFIPALGRKPQSPVTCHTLPVSGNVSTLSYSKSSI